MRCEDARFAIAANPQADEPDLAAHLASCAACSTYANEMRELDRRLLAALRVPVPAADALPLESARVHEFAPPRPAASKRGPRVGLLALAASAAGAAVLAGMLWSAFPRESLADAVVGHMSEEPGAWQTSVTLPAAEVEKAFAGTGVRLAPGAVDVTYASLCSFRGGRVPHLVVRTADGPVTVMILPKERVAARVAFDEGGYRGVLVPAPRGAVAVLGRDRADFDAIARRALAAIRYVD